MRKLLLSAAALAAFSTAGAAEIPLSASVPQVCTATWNAAPGTIFNLDLTNLDAAQGTSSITYKCNVTGNIIRTITSTNGGKLLRNGTETGSGKEIPYLFSSSGGSGLTLTPTSLATPLAQNLTGSTAFLAGQTGQPRVTIPSPLGNLFEGTYTDTVTITFAP